MSDSLKQIVDCTEDILKLIQMYEDELKTEEEKRHFRGSMISSLTVNIAMKEDTIRNFFKFIACNDECVSNVAIQTAGIIFGADALRQFKEEVESEDKIPPHLRG